MRPDPWHVLVGELCLRRVPLRALDLAYRAVVTAAPTPHVLAHDPVAGVTALQRAGLKAGAQLAVRVVSELVERHGGQVPDDETALRELEGVGDYVCEAVLCFAFGRKAVLVDGTSARVSSRVDARDETRRFQLRLDLFRLAGAPGPDAVFNAALLDLGDALCVNGEPACHACPVVRDCATGRARLDLTSQLAFADPASAISVDRLSSAVAAADTVTEVAA